MDDHKGRIALLKNTRARIDNCRWDARLLAMKMRAGPELSRKLHDIWRLLAEAQDKADEALALLGEKA